MGQPRRSSASAPRPPFLACSDPLARRNGDHPALARGAAAAGRRRHAILPRRGARRASKDELTPRVRQTAARSCGALARNLAARAPRRTGGDRRPMCNPVRTASQVPEITCKPVRTATRVPRLIDEPVRTAVQMPPTHRHAGPYRRAGALASSTRRSVPPCRCPRLIDTPVRTAMQVPLTHQQAGSNRRAGALGSSTRRFEPPGRCSGVVGTSVRPRRGAPIQSGLRSVPVVEMAALPKVEADSTCRSL